jgi:hypothetical protein
MSVEYSGKLFLADEDGNYYGLSRKFDVRITADAIVLSEIKVPLLKVQRAERLGSGAYLQYVGPNGLPTRICLTTSDLFGIGRNKKITAFLEAVNSSIAVTRKNAPAEQVVAAQKTAPSDTCHDCQARGGVPLAFGTMFSVVVFSQWSTKEGVFCRDHATRRGISALLTTGLLGWWSLRGLFFAPALTVMNIRSLWRHSTLSKPAVLALSACAFLPAALILAFIVHSAMSS